MMNDGTNYDESGFQTMIPSKYVEGKDYKIAIAFYVDQERYILKTDQEFVVKMKKIDILVIKDEKTY